jgi:hypothetical protein
MWKLWQVIPVVEKYRRDQDTHRQTTHTDSPSHPAITIKSVSDSCLRLLV